jgi:hypothetical protein
LFRHGWLSFEKKNSEYIIITKGFQGSYKWQPKCDVILMMSGSCNWFYKRKMGKIEKFILAFDELKEDIMTIRE